MQTLEEWVVTTGWINAHELAAFGGVHESTISRTLNGRKATKTRPEVPGWIRDGLVVSQRVGRTLPPSERLLSTSGMLGQVYPLSHIHPVRNDSHDPETIIRCYPKTFISILPTSTPKKEPDSCLGESRCWRCFIRWHRCFFRVRGLHGLPPVFPCAFSRGDGLGTRGGLKRWQRMRVVSRSPSAGWGKNSRPRCSGGAGRTDSRGRRRGSS